jgi:hypothetical protein
VGILGKLFGGGIKDTLEGVGGFAKDVRSAITGELPPEKRAELEARAREIEASVLNAQAEVNRAEAASSRLFVAGWRPAIGWVGALALFTHYIVRPVATWLLPEASLPEIDLNGLYPIIVGMLGLGVARTFEKFGGVQDRH